MIVDLFAGAGGWDVGARMLGLDPVGIELDEAACRTRRAAGLRTIRSDVEQLPVPDLARVEGLIASPRCPDFSNAGNRAGIGGRTGRLMHEVPRWVDACRPRWVACEQVPPALEWWERFASEFLEMGYRAWSGILNAADYGVPQTRRRAFLLLSLDRQPWPPDPTHDEDSVCSMLGLRPWVSMAEALGWPRDAAMVAGPQANATVRTADRPAATILGSADNGGWVLCTNRDQRPDGSRQEVEASPAAPTVTAVHGQWAWRRPATTVMGDPRIAPPGHHDSGGGRNTRSGAVHVTIPELGVLQGFPADYPWQGTKTEQARQVGNAVPPLLASHVLAAVTGLPSPKETS